MMNRAARNRWTSAFIRTVVVACILIGTTIPAALASEPGTRLYISHRARLTAHIPETWTLSSGGLVDFRGPDGFVTSTPLAGDRLAEVCDAVAASMLGGGRLTPVEWTGQAACRVDGQFEGAPTTALVVAHPHPFAIGPEAYQFAAILTDPHHFQSIVDSVSFDPARVTPQAYADSVLEIMEERAWWADGVDWEKIRTDAEPLIRDAETFADTHIVIQHAIIDLRGVGDNHSFFQDDTSILTASETTGYGMALSGRTVTLVYPDGPAARGGIRVGDAIEFVEGQRFQGVQPLDAVATGEITVLIQRPGEPDLLNITIESGPYSLYLPPIVDRVNDDIGYVELFGNVGLIGEEQDYVAVAHDGIERVGQTATCGWIVDLRRNGGGNYAPMVTAVGPLLGNGPMLQWVTRSGEATTVVYRDGQVIDDGRVVSDDLVQGPMPTLPKDAPPIAVLIGPITGSSGEATALAFVGRPDTRLFGATSGGYTTANSGYLLLDGAMLLLAQSAMADRTGTTHLEGIEPDVAIPASTDWASYGTMDDPVIEVAAAWLGQQPGCEE